MKKYADIRIDMTVCFEDNGDNCLVEQAIDTAIDDLGSIGFEHNIEVIGAVRDTETPSQAAAPGKAGAL